MILEAIAIIILSFLGGIFLIFAVAAAIIGMQLGLALFLKTWDVYDALKERLRG